MPLNLGHLAIFRAVAETRSVSRGAERLMISQPAVSKQVAQLERAVGIKLLERHARGVRTTEAGKVLAEYARRIAAIETEAEDAMREFRGLRRGRLRIGASPTIGTYLLPDVFVRFRQNYPQVQLRLEVSRSQEIERRLRDADLDVGFTEAFGQTPDLEATVLRNDELVAVAAPGHAVCRRKRVTLQEFCALPLVVRDTGSETRSFVERALTSRGVSVRPIMSLGSTEAIKCAVAAGVGVAIVSRLAIGLELETRRLRVVRVQSLSLKRPLYRLTRIGAVEEKPLTAFLEMVPAAMRR